MNILSIIRQKLKLFYIFKLGSSFGTQLVSLFLIYLFSPDEYGQLALVITVAQLLYILTTGWTDPTIVNIGTKEYIEKGSYKNIVLYRLIIVFICFILVSLSYVIFKERITDLIKDESYIGETFILFLGFSIQSFFNQLLYPCSKNNLQSMFDIVYTILFVLIVCFFCRSIKSYVYIFFVLNLAYAVLVSIFYWNFFKKDKLNISWSGFNKTLYFSIWQILGVLGIYLTNLGVNYVYAIENISVSDIGLYNVAYKLFSEFTPIFAICMIIIPQWIYGSRNKDKLIRNIRRNTAMGVGALSFVYLLIYFLLTPFFNLIGKYDYLQSVDFYLWLFPAFVFMCYSQIIQLIIMTTSAFKYIQYATLVQGVILVFFCFAFVHFFGIIGAIISVTIAYLGKSVYLYSIYHKKAIYLIKNISEYE